VPAWTIKSSNRFARPLSPTTRRTRIGAKKKRDREIREFREAEAREQQARFLI
jgi:hypothetical protein